MGNTTTTATYVMPVVDEMTNLEAALAYAAAGMFVVPTRYGEKDPGGVVGKNWPAQSTIDPDRIREWWGANPRYGIALHCGRSGLIVFDVDDPDKVPEDWFDMLAAAPANGTRTAQKSKGHYFFRMPPGRSLSNSLGRLPRGWGDVRGANGVVILPPSTHPGQVKGSAPKDKGGKYYQRRGGEIPYLPEGIAALMNDRKPGDYALTDKELQAFIKFNHAEENPKLLKNVLRRYGERVEAGESRHTSAVEALCWAFREVRAGMYSAQRAIEEIRDAFSKSLSEGDERPAGEGEWFALVAWAASQAQAEDPEKIRKEIADRKKQAQQVRAKSDLYRPGPGVSTDHEHAQAVVRWVSDQAVYARDAASWILRDDDKWIVSPSLAAEGVISLVAEAMPEGEEPEDAKNSEEWTQSNWDWINRRRYQNGGMGGSAAIEKKMRAIVTSRKTSDQFTYSLADLDSDPDVLWTPGGPVDLLVGPDGKTLRDKASAIDPNAVHLHCTAYTPADVPTPLWDAFVAAVWPDPMVRQWALQLMAVGLTGISPKMYIHLYGRKHRGKTSVPVMIADVLGTYGTTSLNANIISGDSQPWDRATLHGLRFGFIDEMPSTGSRATEILKRITGGGKIDAAYKGKQPFEFKTTHTLVLASNNAPGSLDDDAVVGRIRAIECNGRISAVEATRAAIGELPDRAWQAEAPGVLHKLIELCRNYRRDPSVIAADNAPAVIKRSTGRLVEEQNVFEQWLESHTIIVPPKAPRENWSSPTEIYDAFIRWCKNNHRGRRYLGNTFDPSSVGTELKDLAKKNGYLKVRTKHGMLWNIELNPAKIKNFD